MRTTPVPIASLVLLVASCAGTPAVTTTTGVTAVTTTTVDTIPATTAATTTSTSTTTTPPTTTTTTTLPPPSVVGWEGGGVSSLSIDLPFEPALAGLDLEYEAGAAVRSLGVEVAADAPATLAFDVVGTPYSDRYGSLGTCFMAARIQGTVTLSHPDHPEVTEEVSYRLALPAVAFGFQCSADPDDAPYVAAFRLTLVDALTGIWGVGAVPYLQMVLDAEITHSGRDYPWKAAAMDAFRGFPDDEIVAADTRRFLASTIEVLADLIDSGNTPHGLDAAARRLLEAYAGTGFGVATPEDVTEWRAWLDGWEG